MLHSYDPTTEAASEICLCWCIKEGEHKYRKFSTWPEYNSFMNGLLSDRGGPPAEVFAYLKTYVNQGWILHSSDGAE